MRRREFIAGDRRGGGTTGKNDPVFENRTYSFYQGQRRRCVRSGRRRSHRSGCWGRSGVNNSWFVILRREERESWRFRLLNVLLYQFPAAAERRAQRLPICLRAFSSEADRCGGN